MFVRSVLVVSGLSVGLFCAAAFADVPPPQPSLETPITDPTDPAVIPAPATDPAATPAATEGPSPQEIAAKSLVERDGTISLPGGQATVVVAEGFAYLNADDAAKLLIEVWGNPPGVADGVLGAIVPKGVSPFADDSWAAIMTYDDDGHVSDDDAASINYDDLLKEMQVGTVEASAERVKQGYKSMELIGWAQKPTYDAAGHKLHWAKHLKFGDEAGSLNYAIRALGRTGVLQLNVIAGMNQLDDINAKVPQMLTMVTFNEGHRYADFKPESDPVAAYGLAALVAGGVAAKAGLFKGLLIFLAASWKFVLAGLVALAAALRGVIGRLFGGKSGTPST